MLVQYIVSLYDDDDDDCDNDDDRGDDDDTDNDDNEWSVISEDPMKLEKLLRDKKLFFTGEVKIVE